MNTRPKPFTGKTQIVFPPHFLTQVAAKGFTKAQIIAALTRPEKITEVRRYRDQWRYCGAGVAVVMAFDDTHPRAVTVYADGIVTALRADQMDDAAALASDRLARA